MHRFTALAVVPAVTAASLAGTTTVFDADFEAFTVGSPPPIGAASDRPFSIEPAAITTIENAGSITGPALNTGNFMRIAERAASEAPNLLFDRGVGFNSGVVNIAFDLLLEVDENYSFNFRNTGNSAGSLLNMDIIFGTLVFQTADGQQASTAVSGERLAFEIEIDLDAQLINASVNDIDVVTNLSTQDNEFGRLTFGFGFSGDNPDNANGVLQLDNLFVTQVPTPTTLGVLAAAGLIAPRRRR
ncbi:MAG: hypothetical protein AAF297_12680 [Planctomycetota bacterium]